MAQIDLLSAVLPQPLICLKKENWTTIKQGVPVWEIA